MTAHFAFDNSYARLPSSFFVGVRPTAAREPQLVALNRPLALDLGLDPEALASPAGVEILAGKSLPDGAEPIATAYAGHQFGSFVPQLGDGRAILLGEVIDRAGRRRDIQLKGSGRTAFSRGGDGRAALGPVLREYLVSEAMAALGIPTTRALAAVLTGDTVRREADLPGAILVRVASSHIRVGTFQYFAAREDQASLAALLDHVIARHDPGAAAAANPCLAFARGFAERQARLVARWLLVGFVHGVMNTDNMSIAGETIDFGPCAFLDVYDPAAVFSSIDAMGRYAYGNQPRIAQWNLARWLECVLPWLGETQEAALETARGVLDDFATTFQSAYQAGLRAKLGLVTEEPGDVALAQDLLDRMAAGRADFTLTFRALADAAGDPVGEVAVAAAFAEPAALGDWVDRWRNRLAGEDGDAAARQRAMRQVSPAIIPRNHQVEAALAAAVERQDLGPFERLAAALAAPYADDPAFAAYRAPPPSEFGPYRTFCGT